MLALRLMDIEETSRPAVLLREIPGILQSEPEAEGWSFSLLPVAVPRGALIEFSSSEGGGREEVVFRLLAESPEVRAAWVEERFTIFPTALPQHGVDPNRVLFVDCEGREKSSALWVVHQLLRSQLFGVVVLGTTGLRSTLTNEIVLRRLQLAAGKARASVILLGDQPLPAAAAWPIQLQVQVRRSTETGKPALNILRHRGQRLWKVKANS